RGDHRASTGPCRALIGGRLSRADGRQLHHRLRVIGALAYLISTSTRNRWMAQARRVRNPRYAFALGVGVLYFWWVFARPQRTGNVGGLSAILSWPSTEVLFSFAILVLIAGTWLFGGDQSALAFSQAEVSILFSAPVTRRALIGYKLVRSQLTILVSV